MNVRFDEKSVRLRLSLEEAKELQTTGGLKRTLPLLHGEFVFDIAAGVNESPLYFTLAHRTAQFTVDAKSLSALIASPAGNKDGIKVALPGANGETIFCAFDIDLFSLKKEKAKN